MSIDDALVEKAASAIPTHGAVDMTRLDLARAVLAAVLPDFEEWSLRSWADGFRASGRRSANDREGLGRLVRDVWVHWAQEQPDPKPSWLVGWDDLDAGQREVDMRIGEAIAAAVLPDVTRAPAVDTDDGQANDCRHDSATGVDTASVGPDKVWACDHCGMRWRRDRLVAGDRELLAAIIRERHYLGDTPGEIADALLASGVLTDAATVEREARAAGLTEGIDLAWQHIRQYFADNPNANGRDLLAAAEKAWNADRLTRADTGEA